MSDSGIINYKSQQLALVMLFPTDTIKREKRKTNLEAMYLATITCTNVCKVDWVNEPLGHSCDELEWVWVVCWMMTRPRTGQQGKSGIFLFTIGFKQYMVFYFMHIVYSFLHTKHNSLHTNHKYMFSMYSSLHTFRQKSVIFKFFSMPKIQACFVH